MHRANVSEIHLCQRCPRLLAYQTRGWKDAWKTGLPGDGDLPGKLFHEQIAAPFYKVMADAANPLPRQQLRAIVRRSGKSLELELLSLVEKHFFLPLMARKGRLTMKFVLPHL